MGDIVLYFISLMCERLNGNPLYLYSFADAKVEIMDWAKEDYGRPLSIVEGSQIYCASLYFWCGIATITPIYEIGISSVFQGLHTVT